MSVYWKESRVVFDPVRREIISMGVMDGHRDWVAGRDIKCE